eukprot:2020386-Pyramimonas_sp.AAC.1
MALLRELDGALEMTDRGPPLVLDGTPVLGPPHLRGQRRGARRVRGPGAVGNRRSHVLLRRRRSG